MHCSLFTFEENKRDTLLGWPFVGVFSQVRCIPGKKKWKKDNIIYLNISYIKNMYTQVSKKDHCVSSCSFHCITLKSNYICSPMLNQRNTCTIASKINVTPKGVRLSEKTAINCSTL